MNIRLKLYVISLIQKYALHKNIAIINYNNYYIILCTANYSVLIDLTFLIYRYFYEYLKIFEGTR